MNPHSHGMKKCATSAEGGGNLKAGKVHPLNPCLYSCDFWEGQQHWGDTAEVRVSNKIQGQLSSSCESAPVGVANRLRDV